MKKLFLLLLSVISLTTFGQVYNPAKHTVTNKSYGMGQAGPTDARSYFYDENNFKYRAYVDTGEVKSYLTLPKYRTGQFDIIVNTGGTLGVDGIITGGTNSVWYFKDGTDDDDLVEKIVDVDLTKFGVAGQDDIAAEVRSFNQNGNGITFHNGLFRLGRGNYATQTGNFSSFYFDSLYAEIKHSDGTVTAQLLQSISNGGEIDLITENGAQASSLLVHAENGVSIAPQGGKFQVTGLNSGTTSNGVYYDNLTGRFTYGSVSSYVDPLTTIGDILYRNGSNVTTRLPIGTTNQVLNVSGSGVPAWTSTQRWSGDFPVVSTTSTNATLVDNQPMMTYLGTGGHTLTLPTTVDGSFLIKNGGSGSVTVQRGGSATIYTTSSVTSFSLAPGESVFLTGYATSSIWQTLFSSSGSAVVPTSRTLTINGTTYDLSADRSWTITSAVPTWQQTINAGRTNSGLLMFDSAMAMPPDLVTPALKEWLHFEPLVSDYDSINAPFLFNQGAFRNNGKPNEVMTFGWNVDAGGGPYQSGKPGIGESWEQNYQTSPTGYGSRLLEKHEIYLRPNGSQVRLGSYTINSDANTITHYHSANAFDYRSPDENLPYFGGQGVAESSTLKLSNIVDENENFTIEGDFDVDATHATLTIAPSTDHAVEGIAMDGFDEIKIPSTISIKNSFAQESSISFIGRDINYAALTVDSSKFLINEIANAPVQIASNNTVVAEFKGTVINLKQPVGVGNFATPTGLFEVRATGTDVTAGVINNSSSAGTKYGGEITSNNGTNNTALYLQAYNGSGSNKAIEINNTTVSGTDDYAIYSPGAGLQSYFNGKVGIGVSVPQAYAHILGTTEQVRTGYDASNYESKTVNSTGSVTYDLTGTSPAFTFGKVINAPSLVLTNQSSTPSTPAAGKMSVYTSTNAGFKPELKTVDEEGVVTEYQSKLATGRFDWWFPSIGSTTSAVSQAGNGAAVIASGTATSRSSTGATNTFNQTNRIGYATAATASGRAGLRANTLQYWRGSGSGLGGYELSFVVGFSASSTPADRKAFVGLYTSATSDPTGGTNPTSFTNSVGFSCDLAVSNNWNVMSNDNTGTATTTTLGANFPANTNNTDMYLFRIYCKPSDTKIYYYAKNLGTGNETAGTISTDLPVNTDNEGWIVYVTNGSTASADAIDIGKIFGYKPYN